MILKIGLILILLIVTLIAPISFVQVSGKSTEIEIKQEKINPGLFYYPLKRAWEKVRAYLIFSDQSRLNYYQDLLNKRLSELKYIVDNKLLSELEMGSQRFAYQAGILVEQLNKMANKEKDTKILENFEKYQLVLEELRDRYPSNSSFWLLLQHDINTLKILSEQLR